MKRKATPISSWLLVVLVLIAIPILFLSVYLTIVVRNVDDRMTQMRSQRSSQFFGVFPPIQKQQKFQKSELVLLLKDIGLVEKRSTDDLIAGQFAWETSEKPTLLIYRPPFEGAGRAFDRERVRLELEPIEGQMLEVNGLRSLSDDTELDRLELPPRKIGAYYAGRVRTQSPVALSDVPVSVRHAVMAIEDTQFLEHPGVSLRSILRAVYRDVRQRRFAEGGSTLTQQLMKMFFFSREKAISRKVKEALYALVTEARYSKETILEAYLNEVYFGQWSTHEIHGVAEGARFYFNQSVSELSLAQSATLAAIIQLPNVHDPFRKPEGVIKRRNLVLKRMLDAGFIMPDEYSDACQEPIGVVPMDRNLEDIGYFMDLVMTELPANIRNRLDTEAMTIYTALNPFLQSKASKALKQNLDRLTKEYAAIQKKEKQGSRLQAALMAIDVPGCSVLAVQGGSAYRQTQFNRILAGRRQPGSLFKPFVALAAFVSPPEDQTFSPSTELDGTPFEWAYDKQIWKPRNYDKEYPTKVTLREAMEKSLNVPTARLAQMVGVSPIVDVIQKAGIQSKIPRVPSVSLGAAEVSPYELASAYTTLARLGSRCKFRPVLQVFDENRNLVQDFPLEAEEVFPRSAVYETVSMLKGVFTNGTAVGAQGRGVSLEYFAGKTGTTNDYKDAWFVGFSPEILTLVWVGYDEEEKVGLTGAAAALPLWTEFTREAEPFMQDHDFEP